MNRDREMAAAEELMRLGTMPTLEQLEGGRVRLPGLLKDVGLVAA
jgi:hypothetical protein